MTTQHETLADALQSMGFTQEGTFGTFNLTDPNSEGLMLWRRPEDDTRLIQFSKGAGLSWVFEQIGSETDINSTINNLREEYGTINPNAKV